MWSPRRRSIAGQFLVLQLAVVAVVLVVVGVISVRQSTQDFADDRGAQMRSVAEYLANIARDFVASPVPSTALAPSIDRALSLSGADDVLVADPSGMVVSASDPTLEGEPAPLGESLVRDGRGWTGDVEVDGNRVVAGHAPILDDDGHLIGLAIAQDAYPTVWERLTSAAPNLVLFLGLGAGLGIGGSLMLSRLVRRSTRGLAASEIATLADHREALLHSIREGVVAVDTNGRVTMINDSARELLGVDGDAVGQAVSQLGLEPQLAELLTPQRRRRTRSFSSGHGSSF